MPEQPKHIRTYVRPPVIRVASMMEEEHALWLNALAGDLSYMGGKRMTRAAIWNALFKRVEIEKPDFPPLMAAPLRGRSVVAFLDVKTESRLNLLEAEFGRAHPVIPVCDALYIRSLIAHFAQQETPHACAERCLEALSLKS